MSDRYSKRLLELQQAAADCTSREDAKLILAEAQAMALAKYTKPALS